MGSIGIDYLNIIFPQWQMIQLKQTTPMKQSVQKQKVNIVFVGAANSGKSCLVNGYSQSYITTIGVDAHKQQLQIDNKQIQFMLWDISGSVTFKQTNLEYCKKGDVVALTFALNDKNSFNDLQVLAQRLVKEDLLKYNAKFILLGCKSDLNREVDYNQGFQAGDILRGAQCGTQNYLEVSAKSDGKSAIQKICKASYSILKDPQVRTIAELNELINPQQAAPSEYVKPVVANPIPPPPPVQYNKLFKVLLMGDEKVGKSAIINQFAHKKFVDEYQLTIGVDFAIKTLQVNGVIVKLQIWDTAGVKKFQTITSAYIKGCQVINIVFDLSNRESFTNMMQQIELVDKFSYDPNKVTKFIIGNKLDLNRQVSYEEGLNFAQAYGYKYMEVSAKDNMNIDELFYNMTDQALKNNV